LAQEKEWQPVTKLGRLVKAGKIKSMEEMYVGPGWIDKLWARD